MIEQRSGYIEIHVCVFSISDPISCEGVIAGREASLAPWETGGFDTPIRGFHGGYNRRVEGLSRVFDLIIVGAGPIGLAAACAAHDLHLDYVVLDKAGICQTISEFAPRQSFYSPATELEIGGIPFPIASDEKPRREDTLAYYRAVVATRNLHVRTWERVAAVQHDDRLLRVSIVQEPDHAWRQEVLTRNVILASGVWDQPRHLQVPGSELKKVIPRYSDPTPYFHKNCLVVGGGNSAAEAAMALSRAGAWTQMAVMEDCWESCRLRPFVLRELLLMIDEQRIATRFETRVCEITPTTVILQGSEGRETIDNDFVFTMIGNEPDLHFLEQAGVDVDPQDHKPIYNESFETRVPGLYVVGSITREPHIVNGRPRATRVVQHIARTLKRK